MFEGNLRSPGGRAKFARTTVEMRARHFSIVTMLLTCSYRSPGILSDCTCINVAGWSQIPQYSGWRKTQVLT